MTHLTVKMLKLFVDEIIDRIKYIIRESITQWIFHEQWKTTKISYSMLLTVNLM